MNEEIISEIKNQLEIAIDLVSSLDERFQPEAFKFVLERLFEKELKVASENLNDSKEPVIGSFYNKLSAKTNIDHETLKLLIEYDETKNKMSLRFTPEGKFLKNQYTDATLIYLSCKNLGSGTKIVDSKELSDEMKYLGIWDSDNYARTIKGQKSYFIVSGKETKKYSITQQGIDRGIELLKQKVSVIRPQ